MGVMMFRCENDITPITQTTLITQWLAYQS